MEVQKRDMREYHKKYYSEHKEKMKKQSVEKYKASGKPKQHIIDKLNNMEYKNIPYKKMVKYDIKKDEKGIYY